MDLPTRIANLRKLELVEAEADNATQSFQQAMIALSDLKFSNRSLKQLDAWNFR